MSPTDLVRRLYRLRAAGDPEAIRPLLHDDVVWREPEVGDHMGVLEGPDAVIDMIERALETTGGTFSLDVTTTVETRTHVAAVIAWSAVKGETTIEGHELAVYGIRDDRIAEAAFYPENLGDDEAFWS